MSTPRYIGGLAAPARRAHSGTTTTRTSSHELEALHADVDAVWQELARLQEPAPPPDFIRAIAQFENAVRGLTARLDLLEKGLQGRINKARDDAIDTTCRAVGEAVRDHYGSMIADHNERVKALESASTKQARTFDETIGELAKAHREIKTLAAWQIDTACGLLITEAREHTREH